MTWKNVTPVARAKLLEVIHRAWLDTNKQSTISQYFTPVVASAPTSFLAYQPPDSKLAPHNADTLAYRIFKMLTWKVGAVDISTKGFGVSPALHNEIADWAKSIWPTNGDGTPAPWDEIKQ